MLDFNLGLSLAILSWCQHARLSSYIQDTERYQLRNFFLAWIALSHILVYFGSHPFLKDENMPKNVKS
jgi:hypothetical protein